MKAAIEKAIQEIRESFPDHSVLVQEDHDGGAFVTVHDLLIGSQYQPTHSWVGFHITFQYPASDVYPHFLSTGIKRGDGAALGDGFTEDREWETPAGKRRGTMISRRANRLDSTIDTAVSKLRKILEWVRSR